MFADSFCICRFFEIKWLILSLVCHRGANWLVTRPTFCPSRHLPTYSHYSSLKLQVMSKSKKQQISQKEMVRLRERELSNGNKSLYLDIYRNGKREREFLKLYLIKEKDAVDREKNRQTLATARAIQSDRQIKLQNGNMTLPSSILLILLSSLIIERCVRTGWALLAIGATGAVA